MKHLIAILTLAIAGTASAQSSYEILAPVRTVLTADIINVRNVQGEMIPEIGVSGELVIDKRLKNVIVSIRQQDKMDPTFSTPVYQTHLKLLSVTKDETCGTVTYVAGTDPRSLSRVYESLTIVDNTKNICEMFRRWSPTEVRLERNFNGAINSDIVDMSLTPLKKETIE